MQEQTVIATLRERLAQQDAELRRAAADNASLQQENASLLARLQAQQQEGQHAPHDEVIVPPNGTAGAGGKLLAVYAPGNAREESGSLAARAGQEQIGKRKDRGAASAAHSAEGGRLAQQQAESAGPLKQLKQEQGEGRASSGTDREGEDGALAALQVENEHLRQQLELVAQQNADLQERLLSLAFTSPVETCEGGFGTCPAWAELPAG
jgi:hypothetical protein